MVTVASHMRFAALILAATLGGCASSSGLGGLASLGSGQPPADDASAAQARPQAVALSPAETPPMPARRPGKRPRALAQRTQVAGVAPATVTDAPSSGGGEAAPQAPSGGGLFSLAGLSRLNPFTTSATPPDAAAEGAATAGGASASASTAATASTSTTVASGGTSTTGTTGGTGTTAGTGEQPSGPEVVSIDQPPLGAYSVLAQRIKYCWLNATSPRLPNHGFYSDIPAGEVRDAKMLVYEKDAEGRRGNTAFKVEITADSGGSLITSRNFRLDKAMEGGFKADLARWVKGDDRCKA